MPSKTRKKRKGGSLRDHLRKGRDFLVAHGKRAWEKIRHTYHTRKNAFRESMRKFSERRKNLLRDGTFEEVGASHFKAKVLELDEYDNLNHVKAQFSTIQRYSLKNITWNPDRFVYQWLLTEEQSNFMHGFKGYLFLCNDSMTNFCVLFPNTSLLRLCRIATVFCKTHYKHGSTGVFHIVVFENFPVNTQKLYLLDEQTHQIRQVRLIDVPDIQIIYHNIFPQMNRRFLQSSERESQRPSAERQSQIPSAERQSQIPSAERQSQRPSAERQSQRPSTERQSQIPSTSAENKISYLWQVYKNDCSIMPNILLRFQIADFEDWQNMLKAIDGNVDFEFQSSVPAISFIGENRESKLKMKVYHAFKDSAPLFLCNSNRTAFCVIHPETTLCTLLRIALVLDENPPISKTQHGDENYHVMKLFFLRLNSFGKLTDSPSIKKMVYVLKERLQNVNTFDDFTKHIVNIFKR